MIKFEKRVLRARFRNPLLDFSLDEQVIEFRKDPLTSSTCRINLKRSRRPKQVKEDRKAFERIVKESRKNCFFCLKNIEKSTPKFVGLKERYFGKNSILFPNLFPCSPFHAVVVLDARKHYLPLNKIDSKILLDSLKLSIEFLNSANKANPSFRYPSINFNFLPSAGASIIHPHFQVLLDDKPTFFTGVLIRKSLEYFKKFGSNFWVDLVKEERKRKERYIGRLGSFAWVADFAPVKNNQVSGITTRKISSLNGLSQKDLKDLALGLEKIFKGLYRKGVRALNLSIFSGPMNEDISDFFRVNLKIVSRPPFSEFYVSDIGFMELIHLESIVETLPEDVAKSLRFKGRN